MISAHSISSAGVRLRVCVSSVSLEVMLRWVVALVLILAVVSKCVSPNAITAVVVHLLGRGVSGDLVTAAVSALVMVEAALAFALLTGAWPRVTGIVAACFFGGLTLVLIRLSVDPTAPHCACMGSVHGGLLGESPTQSTVAGLIRNVGLIAASVMIARGARQGAQS